MVKDGVIARVRRGRYVLAPERQERLPGPIAPEPPKLINQDALRGLLLTAAGNNVEPGPEIDDVRSIAAMIDWDGFDPELDVLATIEQLVNPRFAPGRKPLRSWGEYWLLKAIGDARDARLAREAAEDASDRVVHGAGHALPGKRDQPVMPQPVSAVASVPFMITAAMKQALRDLGFSDEAIREMTPATAHQILGRPLPAPDESVEPRAAPSEAADSVEPPAAVPGPLGPETSQVARRESVPSLIDQYRRVSGPALSSEPSTPDHASAAVPAHLDLDTAVATIACSYVRANLSPPFHLRKFAEKWKADGIALPHAIATIEHHLAQKIDRYRSGSGDSWIAWVDYRIRETWRDLHP
jgi:hypothetical protein